VARILVVEDDTAYSAALACALSEDGHEVRCAARPREALRIIDACWLDLMIVDWLLEDDELKIDGLDLAHHLQGIRPHVPIIFVTAMGRELLEHDARGLRIDRIFEKPTDLDLLLKDVRIALALQEGSQSRSARE
jgi:DNA-binding response OmpR family regulator